MPEGLCIGEISYSVRWRVAINIEYLEICFILAHMIDYQHRRHVHNSIWPCRVPVLVQTNTALYYYFEDSSVDKSAPCPPCLLSLRSLDVLDQMIVVIRQFLRFAGCSSRKTSEARTSRHNLAETCFVGSSQGTGQLLLLGAECHRQNVNAEKYVRCFRIGRQHLKL